MPATRFGRLLFFIVVFACLFVIGRNLYRHQLSERLYVAVKHTDLAAVRDLVARHADVNYIHPFEGGLRKEDDLRKMLGGTGGNDYEDSVMTIAMALMFRAQSFDPQVSDPRAVAQRAQDAEAIVCLLLRNGVNLGAQGERGSKYLKSACSVGSITIMCCLLDRGVDPNKRNAGEDNVIDSVLGYSTGMYGSLSAQEQKKRFSRTRQMVQLLWERGVRLTVSQAVRLDDNALLKSALDASESTNRREQNEWAGLEWAASNQNVEAVKMLLAHGADVDEHTINSDNIGETPLCAASRGSSLKIVELLLAHGANVNFQASYTTPLLSAAQSKHADIFRLLLSRGADPNLRPGNPEQGSLLAVVIGNLPQFVLELLKRGADPKGSNGDTLQAAIRAHRLDLVREFLRRGVSVNLPLPSSKPYYVPADTNDNRLNQQTDKYRIYAFSPLGIAVCEAPECEALLLQAGAKLGPDVPSILVAAARAGRTDLFTRLLALGADVNGSDSDKETALTQAVWHAPDGVETLLKAGANSNYVTRSQRTPLGMAAGAGDVKTVRLLLAYGANVNARPPRAHTALYYARKKKNAGVVALLEKAGATDDR